MRSSFTLILIFFTVVLSAQDTTHFEQFPIEIDSFLNGSDGNGGFDDGAVLLPNDYNEMWMSWTGWAISNTKDMSTPGFMNQYSAITAEGVDSSANYAVSFASGENQIKVVGSSPRIFNGFSITNSTYAYLSMLEGDDFSKRFGGITGDDPDFFLLTIKKYLNGELSEESIEFYLADFRFEDNTQDYIINDWTYLDLSRLGHADSLSFTLSSSDNGQFGMNTPAYFCVDNIISTAVMSTSISDEITQSNIEVFPNPTIDFVRINNLSGKNAFCSIYDMNGKLLLQKEINANNNQLDLRNLEQGLYALNIYIDGQQITELVVKK